MIETPRILDTSAQRTAVIRVTIPRNEIRNVMGPTLGELFTSLAAQGIEPAGPWYTHHLRMDPATFDFEIGVPVNADVKPAGRMTPAELPATRVARTMYHGPYEGLADAWGEFHDWITANGHTPAEDLWEIYVQGPESGPDQTAWRTEFNQPLVGEG